ncbi:hypothetical protein, partial [Escherichia coli]|uniref:hypothetical protein n=1 Tax=Escherichia coli TaxID=562 RepID=UPI0019553830
DAGLRWLIQIKFWMGHSAAEKSRSPVFGGPGPLTVIFPTLEEMATRLLSRDARPLHNRSAIARQHAWHAGCFLHGSATEPMRASGITRSKTSSRRLVILSGIDDRQRAFACTAG